MAIAHVGTDLGAEHSGSASYNITLNQQPGAGNMLVCWVGSASDPVTGISGAGVATFTEFGSITNGGLAGGGIWLGFNASGSGGTTLVVTPTNSAVDFGIVVAEFSGVSNTLDGSALTNSGTSTTVSSQTLTTTNANDLLLAVGNWNNLHAPSPSAGWTAADSSPITDNGDGVQVNGAYQIVAATGSYSVTWGITNSNAWVSSILGLQATVAGGSVFPLLGQHFWPGAQPLEGTLLQRL